MNDGNWKEWLAWLERIRNLSPATVSAYGRDLAAFHAWLRAEGGLGAGLDSPALIRLSHVRGHVAWCTRQGLEARSINRRLSALKGYFRHLVRKDILETSPLDGMRSLPVRRHLPRWLFKDDMESLLDRPEAPAEPGTMEATLSLRDRAILEVFYSTGCRVAELCAMTLRALDLKRNRVLVTGKGRKERFVFLVPAARDALEAWLAASDSLRSGASGDAVFLNARGGPLGIRGVQMIVERAQEGRAVRVSPHGFRHSFASHILDSGADIRVVQELLGHASLSTTQIYTHTSLGRLKELYARAHPHGQRRDAGAPGEKTTGEPS